MIPAKITKANIAPLGALIGKFNDKPFTFREHEHAPGRLKFLGFAGRLDKASGKYIGTLQIERKDAPQDAATCDFDSFLQFTTEV